jgi:hypothetical protein
MTSTIPHLSQRVRHDFFWRLSEGQSGIVSHKDRGPLNLWVRLANAAGNHNGLVKELTDQLAETAGLRRASSPRATDLAALLRAATQLHEARRSAAEAQPAP